LISGIDIQDYMNAGYKQPMPQPSTTVRKQILDEAEKNVNGQRTQDYGSPEDSFSNISLLWNAYLGLANAITAPDVAIMMNLLKVARIKATPNHRDSWVDMAGYAACGAECALKEVK
jgi:hypothetical protein